ncbi:hydrolase 76 protein [Phlyctochytrium bullatum]|nr:hydrolase 76 protein [Phlyctochytrium bullatum]
MPSSSTKRSLLTGALLLATSSSHAAQAAIALDVKNSYIDINSPKLPAAIAQAARLGSQWLGHYYTYDQQFDWNGAWNINIIPWHESGIFWQTYLLYRKYFGDTRYDAFVASQLALASHFSRGEILDSTIVGNAGGVWNEDIAWWGLAVITGAETYGPDDLINPDGGSEFTGRSWLEVGSRTFFQIVQPGQWDNSCGGGIYWSRDRNSDKKNIRDYKSSITNGQAIEMAARLYRLTGDPVYKTWADDIYAWMKKYLVRPDYTVIDGLYTVQEGTPAECAPDVNPTLWSYQPGVLIPGLAILYNVTRNATYLDEAQRLLDAALANFVDNSNRIYEPSCRFRTTACSSPSGTTWALFRGLAEMHAITPSATAKARIEAVLEASALDNAENCPGTAADWNCIRTLNPVPRQYTFDNGTNPRDQIETMQILIAIGVAKGSTPTRIPDAPPFVPMPPVLSGATRRVGGVLSQYSCIGLVTSPTAGRTMAATMPDDLLPASMAPVPSIALTPPASITAATTHHSRNSSVSSSDSAAAGDRRAHASSSAPISIPGRPTNTGAPTGAPPSPSQEELHPLALPSSAVSTPSSSYRQPSLGAAVAHQRRLLEDDGPPSYTPHLLPTPSVSGNATPDISSSPGNGNGFPPPPPDASDAASARAVSVNVSFDPMSLTVPDTLEEEPPEFAPVVVEALQPFVAKYVGAVSRIRTLHKALEARDEKIVAAELEATEAKIVKVRKETDELRVKREKEAKDVKKLEGKMSVKLFTAKMSGKLDEVRNKEVRELNEATEKLDAKIAELEEAKAIRSALQSEVEEVATRVEDLRVARRELIHLINEAFDSLPLPAEDLDTLLETRLEQGKSRIAQVDACSRSYKLAASCLQEANGLLEEALLTVRTTINSLASPFQTAYTEEVAMDNAKKSRSTMAKALKLVVTACHLEPVCAEVLDIEDIETYSRTIMNNLNATRRGLPKSDSFLLVEGLVIIARNNLNNVLIPRIHRTVDHLTTVFTALVKRIGAYRRALTAHRIGCFEVLLDHQRFDAPPEDDGAEAAPAVVVEPVEVGKTIRPEAVDVAGGEVEAWLLPNNGVCGDMAVGGAIALQSHAKEQGRTCVRRTSDPSSKRRHHPAKRNHEPGPNRGQEQPTADHPAQLPCRFHGVSVGIRWLRVAAVAGRGVAGLGVEFGFMVVSGEEGGAGAGEGDRAFEGGGAREEAGVGVVGHGGGGGGDEEEGRDEDEGEDEGRPCGLSWTWRHGEEAH